MQALNPARVSLTGIVQQSIRTSRVSCAIHHLASPWNAARLCLTQQVALRLSVQQTEPAAADLASCLLQVTHKRLCQTLELLASAQARHAAPGGRLTHVAFDGQAPKFASNPPPWKQRNKGLDASQVPSASLPVVQAAGVKQDTAVTQHKDTANEMSCSIIMLCADACMRV